MNFIYFFLQAFTQIFDEKSFKEKVRTGLFILVCDGKPNMKCEDLKQGINKISQNYYYSETNKDLGARKYLKDIGVTPSELPIVFLEQTISMDPLNDKKVEKLLKIEKI
ncbi:hypothetical protein NUSPORA_01645 [Nucleospora cyclopteri]